LVLTPTRWLLRMRRPVWSSRAIQPWFSGAGQSLEILLMATRLRPAWMTGPARAVRRRSAAAGPLWRVLQGWMLVSRSRSPRCGRTPITAAHCA
jgi:hypothetical protein